MQERLPLRLPKMAAEELEQAAREREGPAAVYCAFQSELAKLKQRAAIAYAQLAAEAPSPHLKEEQQQEQQPLSSTALCLDNPSNIDRGMSALHMKLFSSGNHSIRMATEVCVIPVRVDVDSIAF